MTPMTGEDLGTTFSAVRNSLRSYLRRHVSDAGTADDLLQDIFIKALAAINANRAPHNPVGWLYAAARTTLVDYYRSSRTHTQMLDDDLPDTQQPDDDRLHQELARCLRPLVLKLPALYRDTLLATDFDGQSMQSLATAQGLSVSAIKSRASRARRMLKTELLACCHVEMEGGVVTDYTHRVRGSCSKDCAAQTKVREAGE
ncbi:MAG: sigma-70 family RNA polymerase sigma factor [Pseudomonadota bacterium]